MTNHPSYGLPDDTEDLIPFGSIMSILQCVSDGLQYLQPHNTAQQKRDTYKALLLFPYSSYATDPHEDIQKALFAIHRIKQDTPLQIGFVFRENCIISAAEYVIAMSMGYILMALPQCLDNLQSIEADGGFFKGGFNVVVQHMIASRAQEVFWAEMVGRTLAQLQPKQSFLKTQTQEMLDKIMQFAPHHSPVETALQIAELFCATRAIPQISFSPLPIDTETFLDSCMEDVVHNFSSIKARAEPALMPLLEHLNTQPYVDFESLAIQGKNAWLQDGGDTAFCSPLQLAQIWRSIIHKLAKVKPNCLNITNVAMDHFSPWSANTAPWQHIKIHFLCWNHATCTFVFKNNTVIVWGPSPESLTPDMHDLTCISLCQSVENLPFRMLESVTSGIPKHLCDNPHSLFLKHFPTTIPDAHQTICVIIR